MDKIVSIQNLTIEFNRNIEVVKNINLDVINLMVLILRMVIYFLIMLIY